MNEPTDQAPGTAPNRAPAGAGGGKETPKPPPDPVQPVPGPEPDQRPDPAKPAESGAGSKEIGGRDGPDPTRFGDWEINGRCVDF